MLDVLEESASKTVNDQNEHVNCLIKSSGHQNNHNYSPGTTLYSYIIYHIEGLYLQNVHSCGLLSLDTADNHSNS